MSRVDSDEDEHPASQLPKESVLKTYGVHNTGSRINFRIRAGGSDAPCVYYVNNSTFTPGSPDVQLRAGDSKDGALIAFGKFHTFSSHVTLGMGNPDDSGNVVYEELKKESRLVHSEYVFETDLGNPNNSKRRTYVWRRTIGKNLFANYSCLDAATGQLVAYFAKTGRKSLKKVGRLCITAKTSQRFDELLLASWTAIREKETRNAWYAGGIISGTT